MPTEEIITPPLSLLFDLGEYRRGSAVNVGSHSVGNKPVDRRRYTGSRSEPVISQARLRAGILIFLNYLMSLYHPCPSQNVITTQSTLPPTLVQQSSFYLPLTRHADEFELGRLTPRTASPSIAPKSCPGPVTRRDLSAGEFSTGSDNGPSSERRIIVYPLIV